MPKPRLVGSTPVCESFAIALPLRVTEVVVVAAES